MNVKLFQFTGSSYIVIEQFDVYIKVKIYQTFGDDFQERCEFDLSFPEDSVSVGGRRDDEKFSVLMIEKITNERDIIFFNELLACNVHDETVLDILFISIDEKLLWIKFNDDTLDEYSIETLTIAKTKILGLHYYKGVLMFIDENSILTIFYLCPTTKLIHKKEISLGGKVDCFRFYGSRLIYSNPDNMTFLDLKDHSKPSESYANIRNVSSFTIVEDLKFIIAICRNNFLYYIPLNQKSPQNCQENVNFVEIPDNDLQTIPEVSKFYEMEEQNLLKIEKEIRESTKIKLFLERLQLESGDFIAGKATIKFHDNIPNSLIDNMKFYRIQDQSIKRILEIEIHFHEILNALGLDVTFAWQNLNSTSIKRFRINDSRTMNKICLPVEITADDEKCDMSLCVSLNLGINNRTCPLTYPINIASIIRKNDRNPIQNFLFQNDLERCKEIVKRLKT